MASEVDQMALCRNACFAASAIGWKMIVEVNDTGTRYSLQNEHGNKIEGAFYPDKKAALEAICIRFNRHQYGT